MYSSQKKKDRCHCGWVILQFRTLRAPAIGECLTGRALRELLRLVNAWPVELWEFLQLVNDWPELWDWLITATWKNRMKSYKICDHGNLLMERCPANWRWVVTLPEFVVFVQSERMSYADSLLYNNARVQEQQQLSTDQVGTDQMSRSASSGHPTVQIQMILCNSCKKLKSLPPV